MSYKIRQYWQVMRDHSKVTKTHFWMIQSAKKWICGQFLDLGLLGWLDIAYYDRSKCVLSFGNTTRSWRIIQKAQKSIFEWSKVPKMRFLAIILSLVCWIDLILHMMIGLYDFFHSATLPVHEGSFKSPKKAFLDDPKWQKWGFLDLLRVGWLHIAYHDRTECFPTLGTTTRSCGIIQISEKCSFEWSKMPKMRFSWLGVVRLTWYCIFC